MVIQFVAPVMYRRRCSAWPAFRDLLTLLGRHIGVFFFFFFFPSLWESVTPLGHGGVGGATGCMAAIHMWERNLLPPLCVSPVLWPLLSSPIWAGLRCVGGNFSPRNAIASSDAAANTELRLEGLLIGHRPELAEGIWPTAIDHALPGAIAHFFSQLRIAHQGANGAGEIIDIMRLRDQSGRIIFHQFLSVRRNRKR